MTEGVAPPVHVIVVDAGSFTLPYDHALCTALSGAGVRATLAYSPTVSGPWERAKYDSWAEFHRWSRRWLPASRGPVSRAIKGIDHFASLRRFERFVSRARPHVIHFQWLPLPLADAGTLRRLHAHTPLVLTVHDTKSFHGGLRGGLQTVGLRRTLSEFDHIIVHTEYSRAQMVGRGWTTSDRVTVIPHGPLDYYKTLGVSAVRPLVVKVPTTVLFFGSLRPHKGLETLIRAMGQLAPERLRQCRVVIAGEQEMALDSFRSLAIELRVESCIEWRIGFVAEESVSALFAEADVVALPYNDIDQSGVLFTAAAFGRAVVATRVGGIPEVIRDGENGLLARPGHAGEFAQCLDRLLSDAALRGNLGAELAGTVGRDHHWDRAAAATSQTYRAVAGRSVE